MRSTVAVILWSRCRRAPGLITCERRKLSAIETQYEGCELPGRCDDLRVGRVSWQDHAAEVLGLGYL